MTKKLVILNGPPGCGKDALAKDGFFHVKFASELKIMTHRLYGVLNPEDIFQFESTKDIPNHQYFYGLTPRQAYIAVSEQYVKPVHGMSFFGDRLADLIEQVSATKIIASDGGLIEELIPVAERLGGKNILVVKIYRPGFDFEGDSRSYYPKEALDDLSVFAVDLFNKSSLQSFLARGEELISLWLGDYEQNIYEEGN